MTTINKSRQVLLICNDSIGQNMAGPGIRYWEFARVLSQYFSVTLAVPPMVQQDTVPIPSFEARIVRCKKEADLGALAEQADVFMTVGENLALYPSLLKIHKPLVLDTYIPTVIERLNMHSGPNPTYDQLFSNDKERNAHNTQLRAADFIICASEKQRDYWLGLLTAIGRLNPYTHHHDRTFRRLIDVVPFGLPREKAVHTQQVLKGIYKNIRADDVVLIWSGGIWEWLDAPTLIKAMPLVIHQQPNVKLFFMGVNRPNREVRSAVNEVITLSQELGLTDTHVFFNEWVPYHERQNYLLEADLGVSLHLNQTENQFAFRTRFLDHLWTGLPLLATEGDMMSSELVKFNLARTVKAGDVTGVAQAILEAIKDKDTHNQVNLEDISAEYCWETVAGPLVEFCAKPYFAPDKAYLQTTPVIEIGPTPHWKLPLKAWQTLKTDGIEGLLRQLRKYVAWVRERSDL